MTAESIIAAVRSRGSNATDLRDAAHEAHHALRCKLRHPWNREVIHRALVELCDSSAALLVAEELDARAVEWAVCEANGVAYDLEHWSFIAGLESMSVGITMPHDAWKRGIEVRRGTTSTLRASRAVLNLKATRVGTSTRKR